MSSVKTWRRAALAAYIAAGVALPLAGYALATTQANVNAVAAAQQRLSDSQWRDHLTNDDQASADRAAGELLPLDSRPYSPAIDWAAVAVRVTPSVVMVSTLENARGDGRSNRAWLIPGVQTNQATAWLTWYRAWKAEWAKLDQEREWVTMGAGFLIGDGHQVATAGHVLSGTEAVRVKLASGEWRPARMVGVDPSQDVALLRIEGEPGQPVTVAPAMPHQGHAVATIGAPQGWGFSLSAGLVSRYGMAAYEFYQVEARRGQNQVDAIEDELRDPELSAERKQTLRVALAALRARQAAAYERLQAESALAQLKMIDWSATR